MKVKLLKRIRKRYQILYYPNRFKLNDYEHNGECVVLFDLKEHYRTLICAIPSRWVRDNDTSISNKEEALSFLKKKMLRYIKYDNPKKNNWFKGEILWYKNKL